MTDVSVYYEATPNPHALKFTTTVTIASESLNMTTAAEAARSPC